MFFLPAGNILGSGVAISRPVAKCYMSNVMKEKAARSQQAAVPVLDY